jgi:serine protease
MEAAEGTFMHPHVWTATTVAAGLLVFGLPATPSYAAGDQTTIVVTVDAAEPDAAKAATDAISQAGGQIRKVKPITDTTVAVTVAASSTQAAGIGARADAVDGVVAAEPARKVYPTSTNDTLYSRMWDLNNSVDSTYGVDAEDAWPTSTGTGVVVGVIDTGITAHPDLTNSSTDIVGGNVVAGYDFISDSTSAGDGNGWDSNPTDEGDYSDTESSSWHGTHVAGTIAAIKDNNTGIVGVAPGAKVQPIRVLGRAGGSDYDLAAAITWGAGLSVDGVADNPTPAAVLNLSLGGESPSCPTAVQTAIDAAVSAGTMVVVAAGNSNVALSGFFPANCNHVVRVVATGNDGTMSWYSNYGTSDMPATVSAPGGSASTGTDTNYRHWIWSTWNLGSTTAGSPGYTGMVGTSMAAPHVAGVAALVKAADPTLTVSELTDILTSTTKAPVSCTTNACGAGIVDATAAVDATQSGTSPRLVSPTLASVTISGTPIVGSPLTASASFTPSDAELSWKWTINGTVVSTTSAYRPVVADVGKDLIVEVVATHDAQTATKTASVRVAAAAVVSTGTPTITGKFKVGKRVRAVVGSWSPLPAGYTYRWYRNGKAIAKATKSSYKLTRSDHNKKVSVRVTAWLPGYLSTTAASTAHKVK